MKLYSPVDFTDISEEHDICTYSEDKDSTFPEVSVNIYHTTYASNLHRYCCENLKSHVIYNPDIIYTGGHSHHPGSRCVMQTAKREMMVKEFFNRQRFVTDEYDTKQAMNRHSSLSARNRSL